MGKNKIIGVDFDGTLCYSAWPEMGEANIALIEYLKEKNWKGQFRGVRNIICILIQRMIIYRKCISKKEKESMYRDFESIIKVMDVKDKGILDVWGQLG